MNLGTVGRDPDHSEFPQKLARLRYLRDLTPKSTGGIFFEGGFAAVQSHFPRKAALGKPIHELGSPGENQGFTVAVPVGSVCIRCILF